ESDETPIESHTWSGMSLSGELNESVDLDWNTGFYLLCPGGSYTVTVSSPWSQNIRWFRNGVPIEGANQSSYEITEPGIYFIEAAPQACPNNIENSEHLPIVVETNDDCNLGIKDPIVNDNVL